MKSFQLKYTVFILLILILSGCNYGIFNFSDETGDLYIDFEFVNDNALFVDRLEYEIIYGDGSSGTFSTGVEGNQTNYYISNMSVGSWTVKIRLIAENETVQETEYTLDIIKDTETGMRINTRWTSGAYEFDFQTWQNTDDGGSTDDDSSDTAATPNFSVSEFNVLPAYSQNFYTKNDIFSVNARITGSGFGGNIRAVELMYPDSSNYIIDEDYNDYQGRTVILSHTIDDTLINIFRKYGLNDSCFSGEYSLFIEDYNNSVERNLVTVDFAPRAMLPAVIGLDSSGSFPTLIDPYVDHYFDYNFPGEPAIGSMFVYIVDLKNGSIYPSDNSISVASTSGSLYLPASTLMEGEYEIIVAAIGYYTTTPMDDAIAAGFTPDLSRENLVRDLHELYGSAAGFVCYSFASFSLGY